jgi:hypothetical protein
MTIDQVQQVLNSLTELKKISHSLSRLDVNACNYGLTPRQEKRVETLEKKAEAYAHTLGLIAYHQADPRGVALYLIDKDMLKSDYIEYMHGVAIY